jgi:hypothetical protein
MDMHLVQTLLPNWGRKWHSWQVYTSMHEDNITRYRHRSMVGGRMKIQLHHNFMYVLRNVVHSLPRPWVKLAPRGVYFVCPSVLLKIWEYSTLGIKVYHLKPILWINFWRNFRPKKTYEIISTKIGPMLKKWPLPYLRSSAPESSGKVFQLCRSWPLWGCCSCRRRCGTCCWSRFYDTVLAEIWSEFKFVMMTL